MVLLCNRIENSNFPSYVKSSKCIVSSQDNKVAILTNSGVVIKQNLWLNIANIKPPHIEARIHNHFIMNNDLSDTDVNIITGTDEDWRVVEMESVSRF